MTTKTITTTDPAETIHELNIQTHWLNRVKAAEKRYEIRKHDRDYQAGDLLHLYEADERGRRELHYVERNAKGQFVNRWVARPPAIARITHVLPGVQADGIHDDYCILSITLIEEPENGDKP